MDQIAEAWLHKTVGKNYWRVAAFCEYEDLLQEGYMCYWLVVRKYPQAVDPPHIMRLFQVTFINQIHDLAKKASRTHVLTADPQLVVNAQQAEAEDLSGAVDAIARAPAAIRTVIEAIRLKPEAALATYRIRRDGTRETVNERLCKLVGLNPDKVDLHLVIKSYLNSLKTA